MFFLSSLSCILLLIQIFFRLSEFVLAGLPTVPELALKYLFTVVMIYVIIGFNKHVLSEAYREAKFKFVIWVWYLWCKLDGIGLPVIKLTMWHGQMSIPNYKGWKAGWINGTGLPETNSEFITNVCVMYLLVNIKKWYRSHQSWVLRYITILYQ